MDIKWTGYDRIELGDGTAISVNSETPGSPSAHSKVVGAIIKAVGKIEDSDEPDEPDKPTYDAIADTGEVMIGGSVNEADPKPEEPAGNQAAPLNESKPKLLIDIATAKNSSEGTARMISLTFRNLYEAFDRDEERAMGFVKGVASTKLNDVLVVPMNNDQVIMVEVLSSRPVGHDKLKLVELAKRAIARVATITAVDYDVSVR